MAKVIAAARSEQAWVRLLTEPSRGALSVVDDLPKLVRLALWSVVSKGGSVTGRTSALVNLARLGTPIDPTAHVDELIADDRCDSALWLLIESAVALSDSALETTLVRVRVEAEKRGSQRAAALSLLLGRRPARVQSAIERSRVWSWRALVPRDVGVTMLTLALGPGIELACELCGARGAPGQILVGTAKTVCLSCAAMLERVAGDACALCSPSEAGACSVCWAQVEGFRLGTPRNTLTE